MAMSGATWGTLGGLGLAALAPVTGGMSLPASMAFLGGSGAAGGMLGGLFDKKKKGSSPRFNPQPYGGYRPQPYGGYRPPRIDYTGTPESSGWLAGNFPASMRAMVQGTSGKEMNTLRPVSSLYTGITANRAQGNDVGYAPEWMSESQNILQNNSERALRDATRTSAGSLSAAGLSGNPRAYEATTGRITRDNATDLQNSLSALDIANMERKNQERDVNTARLGGLNTFNFGQEDKAADFDRAVWESEQLNAARAAGIDVGNYQFQNLDEQNAAEGATGFENTVLKRLGPSLQSLLDGGSQGKGIAGYGNYDPNMSTSGGGYRQTTLNPRKLSLIK